MRGVKYVIDESGKKTAVQIDLSAWGKLWEDFHDVLVSEARKHEPTVPWETLKAEIERERKKTA
jgi:hypothetical protein